MKRIIVSIIVFLELVSTGFAIMLPIARAQGDFGISAYPSSQTVNPGGYATFVVTMTAIDGFNSEVTLSAPELPYGVTATFDPNPVTPADNYNSMLRITTNPDTPRGSYQITVKGISDGLEHYAATAITVDFGLIPKKFGTYTGQVTDFNTGDPIAGAHVFLYASTDYYAGWPEGYWPGYVVLDTTTDAGGYYTITGVPLGADNAPYDYVVGFHADDYSETYHIATAVADTITTVDMALRNAIITGRVTDSATGEPIAGATVFTYCFYHSYITPDYCYLGSGFPMVTTDAGGYYTITGVPLWADNTPYKQVEVFWAEDYSGTYHLVTAVADTTITVDMTLCHPSIIGKVTDSVTGQTIEGATITAWSYISPPPDYNFYYLSNSYATGFTTNDEGVYTLALPNLPLAIDDTPRVYNVKVSASGYYDKTQTAVISCGEDTILDFSLIPKLFGTYTGRVTDFDTGEPIAGATVFVYSPIWNNYYYIYWPEGYPPYYVVPEVTTDDDGYYTITDVPLGDNNAPTDYAVCFHADGYSGTCHVATVATDTVTTVDMALHHASITGRVIDANTDEPIEGATVFVYYSYYYYLLYPWGNEWGHAIPEVTTDSDGYYTISNVPLYADNTPLEWVVGFHADGYSGTYHIATIEADTTSTVDMALCHASIIGRVSDANTGLPIPGASIYAWSYTYNSQAYVYSFTTDEEGVYSLPNLPLANDDEPRLFYVQVSAPGYYTQTKSGTIFCGGIITIDFGPEVAYGTIMGTVTDCMTGLPIPEADIVSTFGGATITNEEGAYILTNVPLEPDGSPKTWEVTVMADGYEDQTQSVEARADEVSILDFILCLPITNQPPVANAGGPYIGNEGSAITFDASGSSDSDGDTLQYRWDFNNDGLWDTTYSTDPRASFTWGDDYTGMITVEVFDGTYTIIDSTTVTVNNVAPTASAIEGVYLSVEITLRVSGTKDNSVTLEIKQEDTVIGSVQVIRTTGAPNEATLSIDIDLTKPYTTTLYYDSSATKHGSNPVWFIIDGKMTKITEFVTNPKDPSTYHQIYEVNLPSLLTTNGKELKFEGTATDPGSDDLIFTWDFGDITPTQTNVHYNAITVPDPYPSPGGTYPFSASDTMYHTYVAEGTYTVTLTVEDDDGGVTTNTIVLTLP